MEQKLLSLSDPVLTLAEVKLHLRIDGNDEDSLLEQLINAAVMDATNRTERSIGRMVWEIDLDTWQDEIKLPRGPVNQVVSVKYVDEEMDKVTVPAEDYTVTNTTYYSIIKPVSEWPTPCNGVEIRYQAGYGDQVDASVKQWLLLCVGNLYRNRELTINGTTSNQVPFADSLLHPYMEMGV